MAILFLFTITCSLTSVVLAALTANVGSSFSIFYEPQLGVELPSLNNCNMVSEMSSGDILIFDYWDNSELVEHLLNIKDTSWRDLYENNADFGINEIYEYACQFDGIDMTILGVEDTYVDLILSDTDIYAPVDSTNYFLPIRAAGLSAIYFNNFHTDRVEIADRMFMAFQTPLNLTNLNFANVTSAKSMFTAYTAYNKCFISESMLTNTAINNATDNSVLYNSTHDENGNIHMTEDSQFVLPAVDLSALIGETEDDEGFSFTLKIGAMTLDAQLLGTDGIYFDNYSTPGNYTNAADVQLVKDYQSLFGEIYADVAVPGAPATHSKNSLFTHPNQLGVYLAFTGGGSFEFCLLSDAPIYVINAPDFVKNAEDWQSAMLNKFTNSTESYFHYSFNNFDTRFWG